MPSREHRESWSAEENERLLRLKKFHCQLSWRDFHKLDLFPDRTTQAVQKQYSRLKNGRPRTLPAGGHRVRRRERSTRAVFHFEPRRFSRGPTPGRRRSDRFQPRRAGMYTEKSLDDLDRIDEDSESTDEETTDDSSGSDDDETVTSQQLASSTGKGPWELDAASPSPLKRHAIAPPNTSPRANKRAAVDRDRMGNSPVVGTAPSRRAEGPNATPLSTQLRPIPRPAGPAPEDMPSPNYQKATKTVPLKPPGRSPPRSSLGDDFQLEVNMYVLGHVQKVKRLEERLQRALKKNAELQNQLGAVETQRDERFDALARRVDELTKEKTMMEEKAKKVEAFVEAVKQLDTTGVLGAMMTQTSAQG